MSGESGAGKTETTKHLIQHILSRCSGSQTNLHQKINQMSPVLEAFGNAQTVMVGSLSVRPLLQLCSACYASTVSSIAFDEGYLSCKAER